MRTATASGNQVGRFIAPQLNVKRCSSFSCFYQNEKTLDQDRPTDSLFRPLVHTHTHKKCVWLCKARKKGALYKNCWCSCNAVALSQNKTGSTGSLWPTGCLGISLCIDCFRKAVGTFKTRTQREAHTNEIRDCPFHPSIVTPPSSPSPPGVFQQIVSFSIQV